MWFLYECERICYEYLDLLWKYLATILLSSVCYYYVIKKLITSDKQINSQPWQTCNTVTIVTSAILLPDNTDFIAR